MPSLGYRFIVIYLLFFLSLTVGAQEHFPFRHLTKQQGLSQNSVIAIAQDSKGFMWFGTRDGLNRFDGTNFRVFRKQDELSNSLIFNDVHALFYDQEKDWLWVGTTRGLCRYRQDLDDFVPYTKHPELASGFVHFIHRDQGGILWVGTDVGLFRYQEEEDRFTLVPNAPGKVFRDMAQDSQGKLYVGTTDGLYRLESYQKVGQTTFFPVQPGGKTTGEFFIQDLLPGPDGTLWIATRLGGIYCWTIATDELRQYSTTSAVGSRLSNDFVRELAWGADGSLWAGTFIGLNRLLPGQQSIEHFYETPNNPNGLMNHSVHSLFIDRRGSLWMGSYYGGVAFYDDLLEGTRHYSRRAGGLSHAVVSSFAEDAEGKLWIGTEGGGLNLFDPKTERFVTYNTEDGLAGNNVKSILRDDDQLWIGSFQAGLSRVDLKKKKITQTFPHQLGMSRANNDNVYGLLLRKDTIWMALYGSGLGILDTKTDEITTLTQEAGRSASLISNGCRSLLEDKSGHLWVATSAGVDRLGGKQDGAFTFEHYLEGQIVYSLCEDRDGNIWVGTYGQGLYVIDPQTKQVSRYRDDGVGLAESTIYGIVLDDNNRLWVSSSLGIAYQDPATGSFHNFEAPYDLKNQEFRINAIHKLASGELAFGGTEGFTIFDPADISTNSYLPPLVFTELRVANQMVPIQENGGLLQTNIDDTEELVLPYDNANFSLSFAALDFLSTRNNRYQYKLEGVDDDWVNSRGATEASYTLQNAGTYRFQVRAASGDGQWNPAVRELRVKVLPPPWQSWYAYLGYLLLAGLVIAAIIRYTYLQHELRLEQAAKDQQEALHQAKLRFFTNITHEIRTPLTMILGPLESIRRGGEVQGGTADRLLTVEKNSRRLLRLVNQLLSFRKLTGERENLNLDGQDIVDFCRDVTSSFRELARNREINLSFDSKEDILPVSFDRDKLEKVLYNLIANAFKFTPSGGQVDLHLRREGTKVYFRVTDNGEGIPPELQENIFARFFERKSLTKREGTGIGLAIVREYVEMHGGEITVNSHLGMGSSFVFWIPLRPVSPVLQNEEFLPGVVEPVETFSTLKKEWLPNKATQETPALILIVEDNLEVRDYIESVLVADYQLETAANGKEGLEKALAQNPDLVVSDVMMPEMDGIGFCSALKTNLQTSHIPLILLTAKSSDLQRLEGLEIGADDYITKPFSPRELQLRIRNILFSVSRAREKAARTLRLEPGEVKVTPADATFLDKAIDLVNRHMDNPHYKVDDFARDLTVSRALLFTKIKAITGHTPNGFIKLLRMKRAAQLVRTGEFSVAQIANQVGYRDVKYFSKSFRQAHGASPSTFTKTEKGT